jgi:hypothetical protein
VIEGRRDGGTLRFTKTYDDVDLTPDVVHYFGGIQKDGDEVEGRWTIPHDGAGSFMMMRKSRATAAQNDR